MISSCSVFLRFEAEFQSLAVCMRCVVYVIVTVVLWFTDEHRLSDYSIGPEAKLNLVVRPAGERSSGAGGTSSCNNDKAGSGVWQLLSTVLAKHFSPADAAKVQEQLIKDYERSLRQLSLDDIERLASRLLHPETEAMDTSYMD
ncbi:hypothetical protein ABG768_026148 [Culter alburnus]|uniref:Ubl4 C-terminal TUGS domain-containing protein n=1 Tax=Culter alburnus TaxID=194366 RepID=A0AAW2A9T7_CULAL